MGYVSFISDKHLKKCIEILYDKYEKTKKQFTEKKFYENQVDPIKLLFDTKFFGTTEKDKVLEEIQRQIDKTISNAIGEFHEDLIDGIDGYKKHPVGEGFDITDKEGQSLFADIKNKHNTVTGTHLSNLYRKLEGYIEKKEGAKAYWVQIISSGSSFEEQWKYENKDKTVVLDNQNVYKVSADKFYEILTGNPSAFAELCEALPEAIEDFLKDKTITSTSDKNLNVYDAINEKASALKISFLEQIMNDTFGSYTGFPISMQNNYVAVDLFSGSGGLALGLEKSGFNTIGLIDIDKDSCRTLKHNRPNWNVIQEDITEIANNGIRSYIDNNLEVDLLTAGCPCPELITSAKTTTVDETTNFYNFSKILKELNPKVFLFENVKGLISHNEGETFKVMTKTLEDLGYNVKHKVIKAENYGVAHKLERLIVIGTRKDLSEKFEFPSPYEKACTLRDTLKDLPESNKKYCKNYTENKKKILEIIPEGSCLTDLSEEMVKAHMGKTRFRRDVLRRLDWDKYCLRLEINPNLLCHPDETRALTTREYARIQSFPDEWEFKGSATQMYKQIANAFPVELGKSLGKSISDYLDRVK